MTWIAGRGQLEYHFSMVRCWLFVTGAVIAGCAHHAKQDEATGADGVAAGAMPLVLEEEARADPKAAATYRGQAEDVVSYPAGDRVDWKVIELPAQRLGTLALKLTWTSPRPGLRLAFDVHDARSNLVVEESGRAVRSRETTIERAAGKYFVRVYAQRPGDAGNYKLVAEFKPAAPTPAATMPDSRSNAIPPPLPGATRTENNKVPEPPKLAAMPDHAEPCNDTNFDARKPECKSFCPSFGAPDGWPPCEGKCPRRPSVDIAACWDVMPCPRPPDVRVKACKAKDFPPCNRAAPDPGNPNCDEPVYGRVTKREVQGREVRLTIGAGSNQGVQKSWRAVLISGPDLNSKPVSGGEIHIVNVDKNRSIGTARLTATQVDDSPHVKLFPPPK
jgi:hypothetical protein